MNEMKDLQRKRRKKREWCCEENLYFLSRMDIFSFIPTMCRNDIVKQELMNGESEGTKDTRPYPSP